jgi:DNA-binding transcriptional LysR family regulator
LKLDFFCAAIICVDTRRLDLNLLLALEALLAERNVTRAAARLHLSQPALSAQLARLRDLFGDKLLLPAQRGMIPTARALELEEPLRRALDEVRRVAVAGAGFEPSRAQLTVTVAASDYVQVAVLIDFALQLRREAPLMRLGIRTLDGAAVGGQMERGEVDLALMTAETAPPALRRRVLFEETYQVITRRRHPRIRRTLTLEKFLAEEHIVVSPRGGSFSTAADVALSAVGATRRVAISAASFLFVPELVERADFVALVPSRLVRNRAERLAIFEPPVAIPGFAISLIWHDRTHEHPAHAWLRERLWWSVNPAVLDSAAKAVRRRRRP